MFVELLLVTAVGASAAGIAYLNHYSTQERKALEKKRQEDERQFRLSLLRELRRPRSKDFRLSDFRTKCEVSKELAERTADEIYSEFCRKVVADGIVNSKEQAELEWLTVALELDAVRVQTIVKRVKEEKYKQAVDDVLADGTITPEEAAHLECIRRQMGVSTSLAFQLTQDRSRSAYLMTFRQIVRDGVVTAEERQELLRWKQALAISDADASEIVRAEALALYRQCVSTVIQDGMVTPEEESKLTWLQEFSGLRDSDVASFRDRIQEVNRLASYRQGKLPSVKTALILEGGEICHWHDLCTLRYETRTSHHVASGELAVTSKNIYFASPVKSFSYRPHRILDIIRGSNGLQIKVNGRQGSGEYFTSRAEELEAILSGVVSKHKFLLSESYSAAQTRHIPDDVKRDVWDRDGGRCTRCSATDYLEFDHIIPYTRGGSNTAKNVQILCRKCNLLKSDRI
jgi:tellurite resistance protein